MAENKIYVSSSPHFGGPSTRMIMLCVLIALLPECIAGGVFFGFRALSVILVSALSAVLFEFLFQLITRQRITVSNLSAAVTGVLLALVCPPAVPLWMVVLGSLVAVVVAKGLFGGIGSNVFNPALTGRAVMVISFPAVMGGSWVAPRAPGSVDAVSSATVLSGIKSGSYEPSAGDLWNFFIGRQAGCIGETSALLILISFVLLLVSRIIDWRATAGMLITFSAATFMAALSRTASVSQSLGSVALALVTGGVLFGAVFMVTDYATAPITKPGRLVFGAGAGLVTFLIRQFGGYPEGVMFSILIMNSIAPFLNNLTYRSYGYGKKGSRLPDTARIDSEFGLGEA